MDEVSLKVYSEEVLTKKNDPKESSRRLLPELAVLPLPVTTSNRTGTDGHGPQRPVGLTERKEL